MRWRPQEENERERPRQRPQGGICRGGTGKDGKAAGQAADDDVGPAAPLQPHRVDNRIEKRAKENERGRLRIDDLPCRHHRECQHRRKHQQPPRLMRQGTGHERSRTRTRHETVTLILVVVVERSGGSRCKQRGQRHHQHLPGAGGPGRDHIANYGRDHDEHADAQLEQAEHIAQYAGKRTFGRGNADGVHGRGPRWCWSQVAPPHRLGETGAATDDDQPNPVDQRCPGLVLISSGPTRSTDTSS